VHVVGLIYDIIQNSVGFLINSDKTHGRGKILRFIMNFYENPINGLKLLLTVEFASDLGSRL